MCGLGPFGAMSEARSRPAEPRAAARDFPEAFGVARDAAQVSRARAKSSIGTSESNGHAE